MKGQSVIDGDRFGSLTVLSFSHKNKHGVKYFNCQCDCGNKKAIRGTSLVKGITISCGCNKYKVKKDLVGKIFGRLEVIEYVGDNKWKCRCNCEKKTEKIFHRSHLTSGTIVSCGCYRKSLYKTQKKSTIKIKKEKKIISKEILEEYYVERGLCQTEIAKILKTSKLTINRNLKLHNIRVNASAHYNKNTRKELLNDFSELTPETSYWAGFIFGDGSIVKDSGRLVLALSLFNGGNEHLKKFSNFLFGHIEYIKLYDRIAHIAVTHESLAYNLSKFGIIPNKTYDSTLILPEKFKNHFIRGYFDADGWFSLGKYLNKKHQKKYYKPTFGLCSYRIENMQKVLECLPITNCNIRKKHNHQLYYIAVTSQSNIKSVNDFLKTDNENIYYREKWGKIWNYLEILKK